MCDPVTVSLATTAMVAGTTTTAVAAGATVGFWATAAGIAAGAATGAAWGVAINAGVNIATGRNWSDGWGSAALMGGLTGGVQSGFSQYGAKLAGTANVWEKAEKTAQLAKYASYVPSNTSAVLSSAGGSMMNSMAAETFTGEVFGHNPIAYNTIQNQVTGSGGTQATASLAKSIKAVKNKRSKQASESMNAVNTSSFNQTGLALA